MNGILRTCIFRLRRNPLRITLILATVAMGVAVLCVSLSIGLDLSKLLNQTLPETGYVISVANGTIDSSGSFQRSMPPKLTKDDLAAIQSEYPTLKDVTPISMSRPWDNIQANGYSWRPRDILGVGANYADLIGLNMVVGTFFTQTDVDSGINTIVVSEAVAKAIFGSAQEALGKIISTKTRSVIVRRAATSTGTSSSGAAASSGAARAGSSGTSARTQDVTLQVAFTICGVFSDPPEVMRTAYGVGDLIIPYTSSLSSDMPKGMSNIMAFMARTGADTVKIASAKITEILTRNHGEDIAIAAWEGNPDNPSQYIADARDTISKFATFLSVFGLLVLLVSATGVFSIMMVEAMDRSRELGIRRALGATKREIITLLSGQAGMLAAIGSVIGVIVAAVFRGPLAYALSPYLSSSGVSTADLGTLGSFAIASLISIVAAILACAAFSIFPATVAARKPVTLCIKEE